MIRITFTIAFLFVIACNQHDKKTSAIKMLTADDSLRIKLLGKWGGLGEKTPVWEIRPDSIYTYDRKTNDHYNIVNGDFIIDLPEYKVVFKQMTVIEDTMFFIDAQDHGSVRAYRIHN